ncbi:MAG: endolytic transglycosylase MltG [Bacillota bacterium]
MRNHNLIPVLVMIIFILSLATISYLQLALGPVAQQEVTSYEVKISQGASTDQIADTLYNKGLIRNRLLFIGAVRLQSLADDLQAGYYRFDTGMSVNDLITKLVNHQVINYRIIIPEGFTVEDIAQKLSAKLEFSQQEFLAAARQEYPTIKFLSQIDHQALRYRTEGYLYPETYHVAKSINPQSMVRLMLREFQAQLSNQLREAIEQSKYNLQQIITIASLIEAEVLYDDERELIAGVIYNRLEQNMPLQIDATIQYILPEHKTKLLYSDLKVESPYNTYQNLKLPPGPINNPGLESIKAALNPADTEYLYYFALDNGRHKFTRTYQEHIRLQNKLKY